MTDETDKENNTAKLTWTGTKLSKDASFFHAKKAVDWIPPVDYVRNLYFLECDDVIFQKDGQVLLRRQGSEEGVLPATVGVKVFNGRSKAV
ncbi:hypothetical protein AG0111_0g12096 [Alternaria gaisen]|uniref:Uncharacterized protein n=1 Tax=Alternaria gaisen TaxID=167740 RepID=A0ACB6F590_9PLEO|nr:hypothetical protein AG0111_0g12096 [Alternaria gaisen]